jgi:superfamily II DNA/RNA helicase
MALFTATLPDWTIRIARRYLHDPVRVEAGTGATQPAPRIAQIVYAVPTGRRLDTLIALLDRRRHESGSTLVFGRTKHGVKKLARELALRGYPVAALQGNMSQNARERVISEFRAGSLPVLLATNVAARGLDVVSIEQVINYELPESAELFTHRVGRTGRMDREGEAITLITPEDMPAWQKIQRALGDRLQPRPWPHESMPLPDAKEQIRSNVAEPNAKMSSTSRPLGPHSQRATRVRQRSPRQAGKSLAQRSTR